VPVDRVEELGFALESLSRHVTDPRIALEVTVDVERLAVSIGPFGQDPLADDGVGRVVRGLVDEVSATERDGDHWVTLGVALS